MKLQPNKDLNLLQKSFKSKVDKRLSLCPEIFVTEGYRSQERQDYLYSLGRTRPGKIVTWTTNSNHTKGIAVDIAFYGSELYPTESQKRRNVADKAIECGIDWGYDLWNVDKVHFQDNGKPMENRDPLVNEAMEKGYYNGLPGDGVTDRTVILAMKIAQGEDKCEHSEQDLLDLTVIVPKNGIITYEVGTLTDDIANEYLQIILKNAFTYWSDVLKPIYFKRVKKGGQIKINFAHPGDERLPVPFKENSIAYAILKRREIWINDKHDFTLDGSMGLLHKLTHEIGHILGYGHSENRECVMYYMNIFKGGAFKICEEAKNYVKNRYKEFIK